MSDATIVEEAFETEEGGLEIEKVEMVHEEELDICSVGLFVL